MMYVLLKNKTIRNIEHSIKTICTEKIELIFVV